MNKIELAATELVKRRIAQTCSSRLEESIRPSNLDDAVKVQECVSEKLIAERGLTIAGWKCLLPPEGRLIVGPVYSDIIYDGLDECPILPQKDQAAIEPELAFIFKDSLPPRDKPYTEEEVYAAIGEVRMAFELIRSRFSDNNECEFPELLADGLFNQGIYLGPKVDASPAEIAITLTTKAETKEIEGKHPNNHATKPLVWFANFLSARGQQIEAGQAVITGSYAGVLRVPMEEEITVAYKDLGEITTRFVERT